MLDQPLTYFLGMMDMVISHGILINSSHRTRLLILDLENMVTRNVSILLVLINTGDAGIITNQDSSVMLTYTSPILGMRNPMLRSPTFGTKIWTEERECINLIEYRLTNITKKSEEEDHLGLESVLQTILINIFLLFTSTDASETLKIIELTERKSEFTDMFLTEG